MSTDSKQLTDLPPWNECDFFCIHDYAGAGKPPCGWRGKRDEARHDESGLKLLCPRCGSATLFRIPLDYEEPNIMDKE